MELQNIYIPFNIYSICAIRAARDYFAVAETQLEAAASHQFAAALEEYRNIPNHDEADYEVYVRTVERAFEDDYVPALRYSNVLYLYMLFEQHVSRHIREIQRMRGENIQILEALKKSKNPTPSLVAAAKVYFEEHAQLRFFDDDGWTFLRQFSHLRNAIMHNGGIVKDTGSRDGVYGLEARRHNNEPIGIEISRYNGIDLGGPVVVNYSFLTYAVERLDNFFSSLGKAVEGAPFYG